ATLAASPLNLTSLWWNWQGGYKFLRLDLAKVSATNVKSLQAGASQHGGKELIRGSPSISGVRGVRLRLMGRLATVPHQIAPRSSYQISIQPVTSSSPIWMPWLPIPISTQINPIPHQVVCHRQQIPTALALWQH
ncbi:MAG: hypothetical protein HC778_02740, partial [Chamaesiphon sp. CSU_1_12]|nr:hypothetical protein [Chamaesiphon sp. CSU_1_12]